MTPPATTPRGDRLAGERQRVNHNLISPEISPMTSKTIETELLQTALQLVNRNRNPLFGSYGDLTRAENCIRDALAALSRAPGASREDAYRRAILWAIDRTDHEFAPTAKEQANTVAGLIGTLRGEPSPASSYAPDPWTTSGKLEIALSPPSTGGEKEDLSVARADLSRASSSQTPLSAGLSLTFDELEDLHAALAGVVTANERYVSDEEHRWEQMSRWLTRLAIAANEQFPANWKGLPPADTTLSGPQRSEVALSATDHPPSSVGGEGEAVAIKTEGWAALAQNRNIRLWSADFDTVHTFAMFNGCEVVRLVSPSPEMGEISAQEIANMIFEGIWPRGEVIDGVMTTVWDGLDETAALILSKLKENGLSREGLGGSARAGSGAACPSDCAEGDARLSDGGRG